MRPWLLRAWLLMELICQGERRIRRAGAPLMQPLQLAIATPLPRPASPAHCRACIVCDDDATSELRVKTVRYFKGIQETQVKRRGEGRASRGAGEEEALC